MKLTRHVVSVIFLYLIFAFICLCVYGFITIQMPEGIFGSSTVYKFYGVLQLFFTLFPAILISSFLIGYSWAFGKNCRQKVERFSSVYIDFVKSIFLVGLLCILLCVAVKEFLSPMVKNKQDAMQEVTEEFNEYIELARYYTSQKEYNYAKFYIDNALGLRPKSEEALSLSDEIEIYYSSIKKETVNSDDYTDKGRQSSLSENGYTVSALVSEAHKAFLNKEYFNAHYYATLALQAASPDDGNIDRAKKIASDAWNLLAENPSDLDEQSVHVYETKKEGYFALINEDYEKAYYIFTGLIEEYPRDLDIQRYHAVSYDKMNSKYFFIDETENLQLFEQYKDIYFSNIRMDGGKDVVYCKGCTVIKKTGGMVQYLRDFSLFSFTKEGFLLYSFSVPYAKMTALPLEYTDSSFSDYMKSIGEDEIVPYILLESADRTIEDRFIRPVFSNTENASDQRLNHYVLSLPYDDFTKICEASSGAKTMPLLSLFSYAKKASLYGYSSEVFFQALMSRLTYPLILLIVFIFTAALSWNYRLDGNLIFKFKWLFTIPFFTFIAYIILDTVLYLLNLLYYVLFALIGTLSLPAAAAVLLVCVFLSTVYFTALRAE